MANSNTAQDGYKALEQRSLASMGAQFESGEIKTSFPPPDQGLTASRGDVPAQQPGLSTEEPGTMLASVSPVLLAQRQAGFDDGNGNVVTPRRNQRPERTFGNQEENTWMPDRNSNGQAIVFTSLQSAQLRAAFVLAANEWEEAKVITSVLGGKSVYTVVKKGQRTINNFIKLVQKLERAYPRATPAQITEMLRAIAGYNDDLWRVLMGKDSRVPNVNPVSNILTANDIAMLKSMMAHGDENTAATERGVVRDNLGYLVGLGHVITGMAAGYSPVANADLRDSQAWYKGAGARLLNQGRTMNNLYAATISGDLGQEAAIQDARGSNDNTRYIGDGTEATAAELLGDIDGFSIGHWLQQGNGRGTSVSQILRQYYQYSGKDSRNRYTNFQSRATDLADQTQRFAHNYRLTERGGGIMADVSDDATRATNQFNGFVHNQINTSKPHASQFERTQARKTIRTQGGDLAYVSRNASEYEATKIASLPSGTKVCPLDPGNSQPFNQNLADRAQYGFTYCMVITGNFEGQHGWISNKFLKDR
jgi:hypothetical protein